MCALFVWVNCHCVKGRWLFPFSKHLHICHKQEMHSFSGLLVSPLSKVGARSQGRRVPFAAVLMARFWSSFGKAPMLPPGGQGHSSASGGSLSPLGQ